MSAHQPQNRNLLLIDEDPVFASLLTSQALQWEVDIDTYQSFFEIDPIDNISAYNLAIISYGLGQTNGPEICKNLEKFFKNTPVMIVSDSDDIIHEEDWPDVIVGVVSKASGCTEILHEAFKNIRHSPKKMYELRDTDAWLQQPVTKEEFDTHERWWVL